MGYFKKILVLIFSFLTVSYFSFSQSDNEVSLEAETDSVLQHKVMLIPYDPLFYLSDAEKDIIEQTKKEPQLIRESFRQTIDLNIKHAVGHRMPCISMLYDADSIPSLKEALGLVYSKTGYRYEKPLPLPFQPEQNDSLKNKKKQGNKDSYDSKIAAQYITVKGTEQFMNAVVNKPAVLNDLYEQYGTDIFLYVNQFEIKTNYKSCLDIPNQIYKRELMIHFSIYDKTGKQLAGAYAMTFFPSDSNNAYDIMKNCFPDIGRFIANCIP